MRAQFAEFVDDPREVEARCLLVLSTFVGERLVMADHTKDERAAVLRAGTEFLLR